MLLAQGRSRAYISEELVVSEGTVKTHISHIYAKLGVHGRQEMFDLLLAGEEGEDRKRNGWLGVATRPASEKCDALRATDYAKR